LPTEARAEAETGCSILLNSYSVASLRLLTPRKFHRPGHSLIEALQQISAVILGRIDMKLKFIFSGIISRKFFLNILT
jgi:hypothetical protein